MTLGEIIVGAALLWFAIWLIVNKETRRIILMLVLGFAGAAFVLWSFTIRLW